MEKYFSQCQKKMNYCLQQDIAYLNTLWTYTAIHEFICVHKGNAQEWVWFRKDQMGEIG